MDHSDNPKKASLSRYYSNSERSSPFTAYLSTLLKESFLCDVNLQVGSTVIPAHRIILASASKYFKKQFKKETVPNITVNLTAVFEDPTILEIILKYIYQGEVLLSLEYIRTLLNVLDHIDIKYLKKHCEQFLFDRLRPIILFQTWELAWLYELQELQDVCLVLCREKLCNQLLQCECIKYLSIGFIEYIVGLKDITMNLNSTIIIKLIIQWLSYETCTRLSGAKNIIKEFVRHRLFYEEQIDDIHIYLTYYDAVLQDVVMKSIKPILLENIVYTYRGPELTAEIDKICTESHQLEASHDLGEDQVADNEYSSSCPEIFFREKASTFRLSYVAPQKYILRRKIRKSDVATESQCVDDLLLEENTICVALPRRPINSREDYTPNWSIILQESNMRTFALYCTYSGKWYISGVPKCIENAVGLLNDDIVCRTERYGLILANLDLVSWRIIQSPFPIAISEEEYVPCLGNSPASFFIYSGSLYSICALRHRKTKVFRIIVNEWNSIQNIWDCKIGVCPSKFDGAVISVSLGVKTSTGSNVYIMAAVTAHIHGLFKGPETSNFSENLDTSCTGNEIDAKVSMKPNETFYVFKVDMESLTYEDVGFRSCEPLHLDQVPTIILEDRIVFILDNNETIEENFQLSFQNGSSFRIRTLVLYLEGNVWKKVRLCIPLPPFHDLPVKRIDEKCYFALNMKFFKRFIFMGLHRAPHIFQIAVYDIESFEVLLLSPIPLSSIGNMSLFPVDNHRPVTMLTNHYLKDIDMVSYHFTDWRLRTWYGIVNRS